VAQTGTMAAPDSPVTPLMVAEGLAQLHNLDADLGTRVRVVTIAGR
jgi:hypothetical protein